MAADTQTSLQKKLAAWQMVQKIAAAKHPDLAGEILSIKDKDEWVRFVANQLPEFKGSENQFASVEDFEKLQKPEEEPQPEDLPHSESPIGMSALGMAALGAEKLQEVGDHESESKPNSSSSKPQSVAKKIVQRANPSSSNKRSVGSFFKRIFGRSLNTYYEGQNKKRTISSFLRFGKEALQARNSGESLTNPLKGLLQRELPSRIPGVRRVTNTINKINDTVKLIRRAQKVYNFIQSGGIQNILNGVKVLFNGGGAESALGEVGIQGGVNGLARTAFNSFFGEGGLGLFGEGGILNSFSGFFGGGTGASAGAGGLGSAASATELAAAPAEIATAGAGAASALPFILLFLLFALLIAGLIILAIIGIQADFQAANYKNQISAIQINCGENDPLNMGTIDYSQLTNGTTQNKVMQNFHIIMPIVSNQPPSVQNEIDQGYETLLNTECILYGHGVGGLTGENNFNTFAKLLLGGDRFKPQNGSSGDFEYGYSSMPQNHGYKTRTIFQYITTNNKSNDCYVTFQPSFNNGESIEIAYYNTFSCTDDQFKFLIAQSLAHVVIIQQQLLKSDASIFSNFKLQPPPAGVLGNSQEPFLPTDSCLSGARYGGTSDAKADAKIGISEQETDEKQRNCFADMVGEYLEYPFYYALPASTISPTPSPTPTDTQGAFSPLVDFPTGKYKDYYDFAKNNLFDGQDLISTTTNDTQKLIAFSQAVVDCELETGNQRPGHTVYGFATQECLQTIVDNAPADQQPYVSQAVKNFIPITGTSDSYGESCGQFIWSAQALLQGAGWQLFPETKCAIDWYTDDPVNHSQPGYIFIYNTSSATIQPGDIIIYGPQNAISCTEQIKEKGSEQEAGHIAIVTEVDSKTQHFRVVEANFKALKVAFRPEPKIDLATYGVTKDDNLGRSVSILGWWRKSDVTPPTKGTQ